MSEPKKDTPTDQFYVELFGKMTKSNFEGLLEQCGVAVSTVWTMEEFCDDCEERKDCDDCDERMPDEPRYMS